MSFTESTAKHVEKDTLEKQHKSFIKEEVNTKEKLGEKTRKMVYTCILRKTEDTRLIGKHVIS